MSDFIVGLTGGIASGKSALAAEFEKLGVPVVDADVIARQVVAPGPILDAIVERFGRDILLSDGTLDRRALRQIVFADAAQRQALEAITHPAIRAELQMTVKAMNTPYAIADIPLLAEAEGRKTYRWLDRILVIDVSVDVQVARLTHRDGITIELANQMIAAQASREQRLAIADDVVVNNGEPAHLATAASNLNNLYSFMSSS
ncbi:Dephospho-CoA kinase [Xanthomonas hydrangeae]|uniref:dephospho-CoA kinase n=1 Tax=Xanthomonas hydrangeae TaxID=2775159 RepID=UPI001965AF24|nr:Dephospho-CoA kinase [Xanthomonas hydrangeae]CAD7714643.1 Dephospho-CoA kinase [Xanthomonas hydrangeae]CAD7724607.1 Dephospho-CoA kinase [Xanthomonas hydrangeae]CAD7724611.1 Dephospho-CoA kinase [Xanthomonas hydrangeae]